MSTDLSQPATSSRADASLAPVPVLMWHHIGEAPVSSMRPYAVSPEVLAIQLDALIGAGYQAVTFDAIRAGDRPSRAVVLTFDDGYRSFLEVAAPLLEARGMRGVLFVVGGSIGGVNDWDKGCAALELLDAGGVREVADRGHEVGAHAWRHAPLTDISRDRLAREVAATRVVLEELSGRPVRSFSYPYGVADNQVIDVVAASGFDIGCLDWRPPGAGWPESLSLTRVDVSPDTSATELVDHAERNAVGANPRASTVDAFEQLVGWTLEAGTGLPPAEGWAAVHAASGPLVEVLRARGADDPLQPLTRLAVAGTASGRGSGAQAVAAALAPLAPELDALVARQAQAPVWGVATPAQGAGVRRDWIRLGPQWSDVARLLWEIEPVGHREVLASYLRRSGRSHGRAAAAKAMEELGAAEVAMLAEEAAEAESASAWSVVEQALAKVRSGAAPAARKIGTRLSSWAHLRIAAGALVRQELREHYAGSFLGIGWAVARPLLYFSVLAVVFGRVVRINEPRYPEFLLAGLVPWLFFQATVGEATGSIRGRGDLLRLAAFPRGALPLATVASTTVDLVAQLVVVVPVLVIADGTVGPRLLVLAPALVALLGLVTMTALLISGLCVRFRDLAHLVPLALFLGFYASPVFYSSSQLHMPWRVVYLLNPVAVIVETFRSVLYGGSWPPAWALAWTGAFVMVGVGSTWRWFSRAADSFVAEA